VLPPKVSNDRPSLLFEGPPPPTQVPIALAERREQTREMPHLVSIRAGQGPSDPPSSDALFKSSVSSKLESIPYVSTRSPKQVARGTSDNPRLMESSMPHDGVQPSTIRTPVIEHRQVSITPVFQPSVPAIPSPLGAFREPSSHLRPPSIPTATTSSAPPLLRSMPYNATVDNLSLLGSQDKSRGSAAAALVPQMSISAAHPSSHSTSNKHQSENDVHPEIDLLLPQISPTGTATQPVAHIPVPHQSVSLTSHVTFQTQSHVAKVDAQQTAGAPLLPTQATASPTTVRISSKDAPSTVPYPSYLVSNVVKPQVQLDEKRSPEYPTDVGGLFGHSVNSAPQLSDGNTMQHAETRTGVQKLPPNLVSSSITTPTLQPSTIPSSSSPQKTMSSSPESARREIRSTQFQVSRSTPQPVLSTTRSQKSQGEQLEFPLAVNVAEPDVTAGDGTYSTLFPYVPSSTSGMVMKITKDPNLSQAYPSSAMNMPELNADRPVPMPSLVCESIPPIGHSSQIASETKDNQEKISFEVSQVHHKVSDHECPTVMSPVEKPTQAERYTAQKLPTQASSVPVSSYDVCPSVYFALISLNRSFLKSRLRSKRERRMNPRRGAQCRWISPSSMPKLSFQ